MAVLYLPHIKKGHFSRKVFDVLDLSHIKKDHFRQKAVFDVVSEEMTQKDIFSGFNEIVYTNLVSCYKYGNILSTPFGNIDLGMAISPESAPKRILEIFYMAFFPLSILFALIPEGGDKTLTISEAVVAYVTGEDLLPSDVCAVASGKGTLKITDLVIVYQHDDEKIVDLISSKKEFTAENVSNKFVAHDFQVSIKRCEFIKIDVPPDSLSPIDDINTSLNLPDINLVPQISSPHVMFATWGKKLPPSKYKKYQPIKQGGILVATLGYGYDPDKLPREKVLATWPAREQVDTHNGFTVHGLIDEYANNAAKFVICRTTNKFGIIVNGATANAIKWLREQWKRYERDQWKGWHENYDHLIVLIPYGGRYMEDEMIQITKATDEGIIIVCAAGDCGEGGGGDVVFPAALGICLSVGVAGMGPKGREIDITVKFKSPARQDDLGRNCGTAAAIIAGMLCLLLSRITLQEPVNRHVQRKHYSHTCVIRELLVNEGKGSHDPQLGYGDGERIIQSLLDMKDSSMSQKIANVFLRDRFTMEQTDTQRYKPVMVKDEERKKTFYNLEGDGTTIVVIDQFDIKKPINRDGDDIGVEDGFTIFQDPQPYTHGVRCATILKTISPNASIKCADTKSKNMEYYFEKCNVKNVDIISLSLSNQSFRLEKCEPVNKAVMAGKIIVFAAGNTGQSQRNTIEYPGRIGNVIVVGGRDLHHNRVEYSPVGREMDFLAEARQLDGGTSYAAPVVAGYIALLLQFIKKEMKDDTVSAWSNPENPNPDAGNPNPDAGNPDPDASNPDPDAGNPDPDAGNPDPVAGNPNPDAGNPDPDAGAGEYQWGDIPVFKAARNVYAMRALLRQLLVPKPQLHVHSETEGFGCLDFSMLFPYYNDACRDFVAQEAKLKIKDTLQKFYKRQ